MESETPKTSPIVSRSLRQCKCAPGPWVSKSALTRREPPSDAQAAWAMSVTGAVRAAGLPTGGDDSRPTPVLDGVVKTHRPARVLVVEPVRRACLLL